MFCCSSSAAVADSSNDTHNNGSNHSELFTPSQPYTLDPAATIHLTSSNSTPAGLGRIYESSYSWIEEARIGLHTTKAVYKPDETVTGLIQLQLEQPMRISSIRLLVTGYEKIEWNELVHKFTIDDLVSDEKKYYLHRHRNKHVYCKDNLLVHKFSTGLAEKGQHLYPFTYKLPATLPNSYHERHEFREGIHLKEYVDHKTRRSKNGNNKKDDWYDSEDEDLGIPREDTTTYKR